tara:strand:- start:311 stop:799 length:489 start_codon:yes stop_codon:yes gene_type:complete
MYNKFLIFILLLLITILAIFSINMEDDYNIEDEIDEAIDEDLEQDNVYDESLKPVQYNPNMRNFISESFGVRKKDEIRNIWNNTEVLLQQARRKGNINRHRGTRVHRQAYRLNRYNNRRLNWVKRGALRNLDDIAQDYQRNRDKISNGLKTIALEVDPNSTL